MKKMVSYKWVPWFVIILAISIVAVDINSCRKDEVNKLETAPIVDDQKNTNTPVFKTNSDGKVTVKYSIQPVFPK